MDIRKTLTAIALATSLAGCGRDEAEIKVDGLLNRLKKSVFSKGLLSYFVQEFNIGFK